MFSTLRSKFIALFLFFVFINLIGIPVSNTFSVHESDGITVNLSGRQRMLTQKMTKEAFAISLGKGKPSSLEGTVALFDRTLKGLISGNHELGLVPTNDAKILNQLKIVDARWSKFRKSMNVIIRDSANKGDNFEEALTYVVNNNIQLLKEMNQAVKMYEGVVTGKVSKLKITQVIGVAIMTLAVIAGWLFIVSPLLKLLAGLIDEVYGNASQFHNISAHIDSSSQSLAEGTTEQAASLEETSSSLEEMSSMVRQNAYNAGQAQQLATVAKDVAEQGASSVTAMIEAVEDINASSAEVSKIIKVIDEIAFQTNLLALNAAVEAARAGEHGKGFAVVAEEVRNLAGRSSEAAKTTSSLIESSRAKAKQGNELAASSSEVLLEIVKNTTKSADIISEIAAASHEQAEGIAQVTRAVGQMDQITQQNSVMAEESASSSEELSAQAENLKDIVTTLVEIVGGSDDREVGSGMGAAKKMTGIKKAAVNKTTGASGMVRNILHKKAAAAPPAKRSTATTKVVRPNEVIPMNEDEFREF